MKTQLLFCTLLIMALGNLKPVTAQTTGSFETTITFNTQPYTIAYYVPTSYDSSHSYPVVVAVHGCGGNAISFRNSLLGISDSLNAIILCPDLSGGQMTESLGQIVPNSIDSTMNQLGYNIDTSAVYLTGFSCNGQETFIHGWNEIYPFRGIIPFNAWIPSIGGSYNFTSKMYTCICTGDLDGSYNNNVTLYDSLIANGGTGKLNTLPGIAHVWNIATKDAELMECFNWIDSLYDANKPSFVLSSEKNIDINVYPNPADNQLYISLENSPIEKITVINILGEILYSTTSIDNSILQVNTMDYPEGIYFISIKTNNGRLGKKICIIK